MSIINSLNKIKQEIKYNDPTLQTEIIAVSKTFSLEHIKPLIDYGHLHYGENKVQEAEKKWIALKKNISNLKLHMIGQLQSNKAKKAVEIFDFIHSLDSEKLAKELCKRQKEKEKNLKYFIQINLGSEEQKEGYKLMSLKIFIIFAIMNLNYQLLA